MSTTTSITTNRPVWVDLATPDAAASRDFYSRLFGWQMDVSADPQYGGYATARAGEEAAAGIGPKQNADQPTVWSLYVATDDVDALADKVVAAGGSVFAQPLDVGDQGRMAIFQDPSGGVISAWQSKQMSGFGTQRPNMFGWAELNARGVERAIPFYQQVFGWAHKETEFAPDQPPYHEFQIDGQSVAGAWEMSPHIPAEVPSYWQVYFAVEDVKAAFHKALDMGGSELVAPSDYPGGEFAIVSDPHGANFGLIKAQQ